ncbi:MAG: single-stranded DNA-binding protein [Oscillospiraceae bacterium]|nr:single-stranded DNA-binding protein [Oscillospiraceae bacterium]
MAAFNKVILIGNLVSDPELKQTNSGIPVTSFSIAVSRRFAKQGDPVQADFINIVAWRSTAEFITKYFTKGKSILVCGSLQSRTWTDQSGQKRYSTEVVAEEVSFVEKKADNAAGGAINNSAPSPYSSSPKDVAFEEMSTDDDLPF